jgi:ATP-binding cassette subfamily G (WHITE) protein 2 (SNQ2)
MYRVSPFTYLIEGLVGQGLYFNLLFVIELNSSSVIGGQPIICASTELVPIVPPDGLTCVNYMGPFMSYAGGYLTNPNATSGCLYCPFQTTDQYLYSAFNIEYSHRWRDVGILFGYIVFNVRRLPYRSPYLLTDTYFPKVFAIFALTYIFRIRRGSLLSWLKRS